MARMRADMNDVNMHYFLRPDHLDAARIWAASSSMTARRPNFDDDGRAWLFDEMESLHDAGACTICALDAATGRMRGFVTVNPAANHLHYIVVAPEALGSGLAKSLLAEARALAPGRIETEVAAHNARALRFFEREGFRRADAQPAKSDETVRLEWRA
jgi:putative acetyltransferase